MKVKVNRSRIYLFVIIISILFLLSVEAVNNDIPSLELTGSSECNSCHGPSHKGHVSYTASLNTPEILINGTEATIEVTIKNNDFPLDSSSLTLQSSAEYDILSNSASINLNTLSRGETQSATWNILVHVISAKSINIQVDFKGVANDHKSYTYTKILSKSLIVSTVPTPILKVNSNPPTGSTFYTGETVNGSLIISNVGNLEMKDVTIKTSGSVLIDGKKEFIIPLLSPREDFNYTFTIDTNSASENFITITSLGVMNQEAVISIVIQTEPPIPASVVIGRIIGYMAYITLFLSVLTGVARTQLRRWLSGRKIRILHADLSNSGFTLVVIHAISLIIPNSPWVSSYKWFHLIPSSFPQSLTNLGLELGRWGLLIMYVSIVSGYYFAKIVKKWGRTRGVQIHMLAYISLVAGMFHAIIIGGTASSPFIVTLLILSVLSVFGIKYINMRKKASKKQRSIRDRAKTSPRTHVTTAKKVDKKVVKTERTIEKKSTESLLVAHDARSTKSKGIGIICWQCMTLNDDDANFCKQCANPMLGRFCKKCGVRNDIDAKSCKKCASKQFIEKESK